MKLGDILRSRAQGSEAQGALEREPEGSGLSRPEVDPGGMDVRLVPVSSIKPGPFAIRDGEDERDLEELAASIRVHGVLQPIVVRPKGDEFELIVGRRRWQACRRLGKETIPALVRDVSDEEAAQWVFIENAQRRDPDPVAEAWALKSMLDFSEASVPALAARLGWTAEKLAGKLQLLDLPEFVRSLVSEGRLPEEHARALLALEDPLDQVSLAAWAAKHQATGAQLARRVRLASKRGVRRDGDIRLRNPGSKR